MRSPDRITILERLEPDGDFDPWLLQAVATELAGPRGLWTIELNEARRVLTAIREELFGPEAVS